MQIYKIMICEYVQVKCIMIAYMSPKLTDSVGDSVGAMKGDGVSRVSTSVLAAGLDVSRLSSMAGLRVGGGTVGLSVGGGETVGKSVGTDVIVGEKVGASV